MIDTAQVSLLRVARSILWLAEGTLHYPMGLAIVVHAGFIRQTIEQALKSPGD